MDLAIAERFFRYVAKLPNERGCMIWEGPKTKKGYGLFRVNTTRSGPRRNMTCAHRIAWEMENGSIPDGLNCLHSCDNPSCVNIKHLFLGTQKENIADARSKGRLATGDRHGLHKHPETIARGSRHGSVTHPERVARGERNSSAKLTGKDVSEIRRYAAEGVTQKSIAKKYSVSKSSIYRIVKRERWSHVR